jgi:hypothetical protein
MPRASSRCVVAATALGLMSGKIETVCAHCVKRSSSVTNVGTRFMMQRYRQKAGDYEPFAGAWLSFRLTTVAVPEPNT